MEDRRLIEEIFPVREVGEESIKERNIRHGHISTLHIWWARRPLAASRATIYAALVPPPKNSLEWKKKREFTARLSKWEKPLNQDLIEEARKEILKANGGKPPRVLDPFAGGGSIPLEALRLGCETYAGDYNPVATLILKCVLEYPQKYGRNRHHESNLGLIDILSNNCLLEDVKKWGNWVLEEAKKEIARFYPPDKDGSLPIGYIWARTIPCQNPACGAEIPLMRQFWLANKEDKKVSLYPYVLNKKVYFKIVGTGYDKMPAGFDPKKGTVSKAIARCLVCGTVIDGKSTARLFREGKAGQKIIAVILHKPKVRGKRYRTANYEDIKTFNEAEKYLEQKRKDLLEEWGWIQFLTSHFRP
jgi:putative DNA methylase